MYWRTALSRVAALLARLLARLVPLAGASKRARRNPEGGLSNLWNANAAWLQS